MYLDDHDGRNTISGQAHKIMQKLASILRNNRSSSRTTSFQILSDLHLEVGQQYSTFEFPLRHHTSFLPAILADSVTTPPT